MTTSRGGRPRAPWIAAIVIGALIAGCSSVVTGRGEAGESAGDGTTATGANQSAGEDGAPSTGDRMGDEPDPTTEQLIDAALAAGEIDEPTAWMYRTWATFGDPQLPAAYQGVPDVIDPMFVTRLEEALPNLPESYQVMLGAYLLRPEDPESAYSRGGIGRPLPLRTGGNAFAGVSVPRITPDDLAKYNLTQEDLDHYNVKIDDPRLDDPDVLKGLQEDREQSPDRAEGCDQWISKEIPQSTYRVWACVSKGALPTGIRGQELMGMVSEVVEGYYGVMTKDMGSPIPDTPTKHSVSDNRIDIYVLPSGWRAPSRDGNDDTVGAGITLTTDPYVGVGSSAWVILGSQYVVNPKYRARAIVHEMFHVVQYAHNYNVGERWIYDATAEWAALHYVKEAAQITHAERFRLADDMFESMVSSNGMRAYFSYIYGMFVEQEVGAEAIFRMWLNLGAALHGSRIEAIAEALAPYIDMKQSFSDFAMRLLNVDDEHGGAAIKPRFVDFDPTFPDGKTPKEMFEEVLGDDVLELNAGFMFGMGFRYWDVSVPPAENRSPDQGVLVQIRSDLQPHDGVPPRLEALYQKEDHTWDRKRINYQGGDKICVLDSFYLVLSDSSLSVDVATAFSGPTIELERDDDESCATIEVADPATLVKLTEGAPLAADDDENDGKPGATTVEVAVRDVPAEAVDDYTAVVTFSGGTLTGEKVETWPLASFYTEVKDELYRKTYTLPLDLDLTDDNRPLTIDAALQRKNVTMDSHTPTVELHGREKTEGQCFLDVTWTITDVDLVVPEAAGFSRYLDSNNGLEMLAAGTDFTVWFEDPDPNRDIYMLVAGTDPLAPPTPFGYTLQFGFGPDVPRGETGVFDVQPPIPLPVNGMADAHGLVLQLTVPGFGPADMMGLEQPDYSFSGPMTVTMSENDQRELLEGQYAYDRLAGSFAARLSQDSMDGNNLGIGPGKAAIEGRFDFVREDCGSLFGMG